MKEYLVTMDDANWNNIFIVIAKDAKDAIDQVFNEYFKPQNKCLREENKELGYHANHIFTKSDLAAKSIGGLHNKDGKIICVN